MVRSLALAHRLHLSSRGARRRRSSGTGGQPANADGQPSTPVPVPPARCLPSGLWPSAPDSHQVHRPTRGRPGRGLTRSSLDHRRFGISPSPASAWWVLW